MITLFWFLTLFMLLLATFSFLPGIPKRQHKISILLLLPIFIYPLYLKLGASHHLKTYYHPAEKELRHMNIKIRPLLTAMKKQEGRLQLKLNENPNDPISQALLLELLGVEALHRNEQDMALQFWDQALARLPQEAAFQPIRSRIIKIKNQVIQHHMNKN